MPGTASKRFGSSRKVSRICEGLDASRAGEGATLKNRTWCGSKPGLTFQSPARLRSISPAPARRTRAIAISITTKVPWARCRDALSPRPPSLKVSCKSVREVLSAGIKPKRNAVRAEATSVKTSTCVSNWISSPRGKA